MEIYKFRLLISENEDFIRDIEIRSDQTFKDFHQLIITCAELNDDELASFHICNKNWEKQKEITLMDMNENYLNKKENINKKVENLFIMKDAVIKDFILEKNQHMIYEYDFLNIKTFFIQLVSVTKSKNKVEYPRCILKKGKHNFAEIEKINAEDLKNELLKDFDSLLNDQFEY